MEVVVAGVQRPYQMLATLLIVLTLVLPQILVCVAESPSRLEELEQQITQENARLNTMDRELAALESKLASGREDMAKLRQSERRIEQHLADLQKQHERMTREVGVLQEYLAELERRARVRARALYLQLRLNPIERAAHFSNGREFVRSTYYFAKVQEADLMLAREHAALVSELEGKRRKLDQLVIDQDLAAGRLHDERVKLQQQLKIEANAAVSLREQREQREQQLTKMRAQALRLETVVRSIVVQEPQKKLPKVKQSGHSSNYVPDAPEGPSLSARAGRLTLPVRGELVRAFGSSSSEHFEDLVFSKGVELRAARNSSVRSISSGVVLFAGTLPSYGKMVIVDHGRRYYSLYGRLEEISISVGMMVEEGAVLGSVGTPIDTPSNFYFEVRFRGKPQDPKRYFPRGFKG